MSNNEYFTANDFYHQAGGCEPQYSAERRNVKFDEPTTISYLRILTIVCDFLLTVCGLCLCVGGWYTFTRGLEIFKLLDAKSFLIVGCICLTLALFGIVGARNHKACLLTMHNIGLLLMLCANGIMIYIYICYLYDSIEEKELQKLETILEAPDCEYHFIKKTELYQCCCTSQYDHKCWLYNKYKLPARKEGCTEDLYEKVQILLKIGYYFVPISMTIQALAMIFGYLVVMCKNRYNRALVKELLQ